MITRDAHHVNNVVPTEYAQIDGQAAAFADLFEQGQGAADQRVRVEVKKPQFKRLVRQAVTL
ncbi:hypothetical protein D3C86_2200270 [compost metagenome]